MIKKWVVTEVARTTHGECYRNQTGMVNRDVVSFILSHTTLSIHHIQWILSNAT